MLRKNLTFLQQIISFKLDIDVYYIYGKNLNERWFFNSFLKGFQVKVSIEKYIEEKISGQEYKGWIKIGRIKFDYEIKFITPISEIQKLDPKEIKGKSSYIFGITVRHKNQIIELLEEEYNFFAIIIAKFSIKAYYNRATVCIEREKIEISEDYCNMLMKPKFSCIFE